MRRVNFREANSEERDRLAAADRERRTPDGGDPGSPRPSRQAGNRGRGGRRTRIPCSPPAGWCARAWELSSAPPQLAGQSRKRSDPVVAIARASRVRVRRVLLKGDWWRQENGPLLAFRAADEQPVALLPASPTRYEIVDPRTQTATADGGNAAALQPFAYSFYRPLPQGADRLAALPLQPEGSRRDWVVVVLLGLAGSCWGCSLPSSRAGSSTGSFPAPSGASCCWSSWP